jgi:hypothetical protein
MESSTEQAIPANSAFPLDTNFLMVAAPPAPQFTLREVALRAANGGEASLACFQPMDIDAKSLYTIILNCMKYIYAG